MSGLSQIVEILARADMSRLTLGMRRWAVGVSLVVFAGLSFLVATAFLLVAAYLGLARWVGDINACLILAAALLTLTLLLLWVKRLRAARAERRRAVLEDDARAATAGIVKGLRDALSDNPMSLLAASFAAGIAMGLRSPPAEH